MPPLQIAVRNTTLSPEMEADIRERAARLAGFYDRITSCRVAVDVPHLRHREGALYHVRIDITLPGGELVIRRRPHEELRTAVQIAFNAARRRLQDYARRRRRTVKSRDTRPIARVSQSYPHGGYGFLETSDGRAVWFDRASVAGGAFERLEVGTEVRFTEEEGEKGPQATTVVPLPHRGVSDMEDI